MSQESQSVASSQPLPQVGTLAASQPATKPIAIVKKRYAYSYARFSTAIQASGDSLRRQYSLSDSYAQEHDLLINRTLTDRGVSGYRSDNLKQGALAVFIRAISLGKVKAGSILLVESLDRLSRDEVTEQLSLFLTILNAGVEIVTLADKRSYTKETINADPTQLIISIVFMIRGWEESERKSGRLKHAWQSKRDDSSKLLITSKCPFWLRPSTVSGRWFEEIPERVEVVQLIFALAIKGMGARAICKIINQKGIKPWGAGKWWNPNYVRRVLRGRAVLGEFQPHTRPTKLKRESAGSPLQGYYPAIIDVEVWNKVNQLAVRQVRTKSDGTVANLFTKLVYDGPSGAAMRFRGSWGTARAKLFSAAVEKGDASNSWSYDLLEKSLLQHLEQLDWDGLLADPEDGEATAYRRRLRSELDEVQLRLQRAVDFVTINNMTSPTLANQIRKFEQMKIDLEQQLSTLDASGGEQKEVTRQMREAQSEFLNLVNQGDPESRLQLRAELRMLIKRITLWGRPEACAEIQPYYPFMEAAVHAAGMQWKGIPTSWPCYKIIFANGQSRWVLCERHQTKRRKSRNSEFENVNSIAIVIPKSTTETEEQHPS